MSGETIDLRKREQKRLWDRATDNEHPFVLLRFKGYVLEAENLHFNHDSAVFMPDYQSVDDNPKTVTDPPINGLAVLRACYLYVRDNPEQKILIVGHTDTAGSEKYNLRLSQMRADSVLYALQGKRDEWVKIAGNKHQVEDYQQILKWVAQAWGINCDPIDIDNKLSPATEAAVRAFQIWYNRFFNASIEQDGEVGKQTWGAIFDLYMQELMYMLETDEAGVDSLRQNLKFVSDGCRAAGAGEQFPMESRRRSQYRSNNSRRVEILFFEPKDLPKVPSGPTTTVCPPELEVIYNPKIYRFEHVPVEPMPTMVWLDVQTVDEFGYRVANVELEFAPEYGEPFIVKTDADGYWSGRVRAGGKIHVYRDGSPVKFGASLDKSASSEPDDEESAVMVRRVAARTVTDIIVSTLPEKLIEERKRLNRRYGRIPVNGRRSRRAARPDEYDGEPAATVDARNGNDDPREGKHTTRFSTRYAGQVTADNLFIAGGWDRKGKVRWGQFYKTVIEWLQDNHPTANKRGFYLQVLTAGKVLLVVCKDGRSVSNNGLFDMEPGTRVGGRLGIHSLFEVDRETGNTLFVDMQTASTSLTYKNTNETSPSGSQDPSPERDNDAAEALEGAQADAGSGRKSVEVWEMIESSKREQYRELIRKMEAERMVNLAYYYPYPDLGMMLTRFGGTGLLENYPRDSAVRKRVHKRNIAVQRMTREVWLDYIHGYMNDVKGINPSIKEAKKNGKPHPEKQLYYMGPPMGLFRFPRPAGATNGEWDDIRQAADLGPKSEELEVWEVITAKLAEIWQVRREGAVWIEVEFEFEGGSLLGPLSESHVKWNFSVDDKGLISEGTGKSVIARMNEPVKGKDHAIRVEYDFDRKETKAIVEIGQYGFELSDKGTVKVAYGPLYSENNPIEKTLSTGVELSTRELVEKSFHKKGKEPPEWVKKMPNVKAKASIGMRTVSSGTVMRAMNRSAPGFFEKRPRSEFVTMDWSSLDMLEQVPLETLGWTKERWDEKDPPPSALKPFYKLTGEQSVSALYISAPVSDPEWQNFWANDFMQGRRISNGSAPEAKN